MISMRTALAGLFLLAVPVSVGAETRDPGIGLELNRLEAVEGACRAYLVLQNDTDAAFSALRYDLVIFDVDGIVARRLALETAPLVAGKTSLKVFDLAEIACDGIGRILVNSILECTDQTGGRDDCLSLVRTTSRSDVSLIK